ncbi:MAG: hypothetical protein ACHQ1D_13870, partial [Nitrososphaerales archaeon]
VNIARKNGAIYSLDDEDNRIQELYNQEGLETKDKIKVINRVRSNDDGKEYIVVNKNVDFFKNGVYKDRYSTREGIVELPLKTTNPDTGATETKQNQLVYTTLFTGSKVDEYLKKADGQGSIPQLVFYEGSTTSNRLPITLPAVANAEFFKEASWTELQVGREKKVLNSLMNRLPEVRKELKGSNAEPTEVIERKEIKPSDKQETKEEVNKVEPTKENIVEVKSAGGQTGTGNKSINQPSKKS